MLTMRAHISMTAKRIWKMMKSKARRDSYVAAHISNTVASQILMLRESKGWTQTALAKNCGMRQSRISTLEDPNYENFEAATLRRIASAFDVALTIRFIPFSELAGWMATLSPEKLAPVDFEHDRLPTDTLLPRTQGISVGVESLIYTRIQVAQQTTIASTTDMAQLTDWEARSSGSVQALPLNQIASTADQAMASIGTDATPIRDADVFYIRHPRPSLALASSVPWR
jgi:transcriptional regulator with XRE-family HTH domain